VAKREPITIFANALRELREGKGWTQEELADKLQSDRAWISQLERGTKAPSFHTLVALAQIFSVDFMFGDVKLNG